MAAKASELKKGEVIEEAGELFLVVDLEHITPGNWRAIIQAKLKSLKRGNVVQKRFSPSDRVEIAYLEPREMEYLYRDGNNFCFMDTQSYEQLTISEETVGECASYLKPNNQARVTFYAGRPIQVGLSSSVVLEVIETEPGARGDTVSNVFKPAVLETGLTIKVPLFVERGDLVKVDTRSGEFLERTGKAG